MSTEEGKKNCQELPDHYQSIHGAREQQHGTTLFDQGQSKRKVRREDHSRLREKEGGRGIYGRSTLDPKHAAPNLPHVAILIPVGIWSAEEVGLKRSRRPRCPRRIQRCRRQRSEWMRPGARGTPGRRTPESKHARYRAYSGSNPCWHRASSSRHSWMTNTRVKAAAPNLWYMQRW